MTHAIAPFQRLPSQPRAAASSQSLQDASRARKIHNRFRSMVIFTKMLGLAWNVEIVFNPSIGTALTDGKTIQLRPCSIGDEEDIVLMEGLLDHEAGVHCRQTDFDLLNRWSPTVPDITKNIWNICEDVWGERELYRFKPGCARTIKATLELLVNRGLYGPPPADLHPSAALVNGLLGGLRYTRLNQSILKDFYEQNWALAEKHLGLELTGKIWSAAQEIDRVGNTAGAIALAERITQLLRDYLQTPPPPPPAPAPPQRSPRDDESDDDQDGESDDDQDGEPDQGSSSGSSGEPGDDESSSDSDHSDPVDQGSAADSDQAGKDSPGASSDSTGNSQESSSGTSDDTDGDPQGDSGDSGDSSSSGNGADAKSSGSQGDADGSTAPAGHEQGQTQQGSGSGSASGSTPNDDPSGDPGSNGPHQARSVVSDPGQKPGKDTNAQPKQPSDAPNSSPEQKPIDSNKNGGTDPSEHQGDAAPQPAPMTPEQFRNALRAVKATLDADSSVSGTGELADKISDALGDSKAPAEARSLGISAGNSCDLRPSKLAPNPSVESVISEIARPIAVRLGSKLDALLEAQTTANTYTKRAGRRIASAKLVGLVTSGNQRIFKASDDVDQLDTVVQIVTDISASMTAPLGEVGSVGQGSRPVTRIGAAASVTRALGDVLNRFDVPFGITYFGSCLTTLKKYDDNWRTRKELYWTSLESSTCTDQALIGVIPELASRIEQRKLLVLITDGVPAHAQAAALSLSEAKKLGIDCCVVIVTSKGVVDYSLKTFKQELDKFGISHATASAVDQLAQTTFDAVKQAI